MDVGVKLTPTQQRMVNMLADGKPHTREELMSCLWDELSSIRAVTLNMVHLRRRLRVAGWGVAFSRTCGHNGTYHLVRLAARSD